jgi:hypothetical protein
MQAPGSWEQYQQKCRDDAAMETLRAASSDSLDATGTQVSIDDVTATDDDPLAYEDVPYAYQVELDDRVHARDASPALLGGIRLHGTIEKWLGIDQEREGAWKASNLASALKDAFADPSSAVRERVAGLIGLISDLFDGHDLSGYTARPDFAQCLIQRRFGPPTIDFAAEAAKPSPDSCHCRPPWQAAHSS